MKQSKLLKSIFLALFLSALPLSASAYDFMVDGIAYNYNSDGTSVTVTFTKQWSSNNYSGLTTANIPSSVTYDGTTYSVTSISNYAFQYCSGLTSIDIPNSVTSIGDQAFAYCSGLTSVHITDLAAWCNIAFGSSASNPLYYAHHLFLNGTEVNDLVIPNSVTSIGWGAFSGCSGLTSITIPNLVTSIGSTAFRACSGLTSVTIPNSVTSIGEEAFFICSSLTSITIPNSVTSIGEYAFDACSSLTSITLTGQGAWSRKSNMPNINQIKTVNIGTGITSLDNFGFTPDVVNCYAEVPPTCTSSTFANYDGALHVPASSMADYFKADYWQNFTNLNNDITEKVTLNTTSATLIQHEELQLTATATPNGSAIIWSSTNQNVATVDNSGKVTATGQGECYIYATFATNPAVYVACHITASYPEITSLTLSETELVLNQIGDTVTLTAATTPANSGPKPNWTSSDETVATVDANGLVTAINLGECDITATVLNQSATCHVTVTSAIIITLDMTSATIAPNEILTLTPSFNPVETDIVATSSDPSVAFARVITQNGIKKVQVLGLAEGTATITVASVDGKAIPATCVVTVSNAPDVLMGDANGDGTVNVSDYVYVANYILEQNPEPFVFAAADIDGNGEINVSDLVLVANIALTYEDPNTLNAPAPKATLNADIDMNAILYKNADGTTSVTVDLNNSMDLTALQMDISLPQGMAVTSATLTDRATRSHQTEVAQLANGNYRLLAASSASKAFKGNEGALLTLTLSGEPQGTVTLGGIKLASPDGQCFTVNDMLLTPVVTGVDDITAQARIYGEAGSIVIESPVNGMAQLVLPNGMSRTVKVKAGRNIYPAPATGLVIVRAGEKAVKLIF